MSYVHSATNLTLRWIHGLNETEWGVIAVLVVAVGVLCMQGFGSRSNY